MDRQRLIGFTAFLMLVAALFWFLSTRLPLFLESQAGRPALPVTAGAPAGPEPPGPAAGDAGKAALRLMPEPVADFFTEFRLTRDRSRSEQREVLREMMTNEAVTAAAREAAGERYLELARATALEAETEQLIRARGLDEVIVHLGEGTAQVVVRARTLTPERAMQIADVVVKATGVAPESISILPRP